MKKFREIHEETKRSSHRVRALVARDDDVQAWSGSHPDGKSHTEITSSDNVETPDHPNHESDIHKLVKKQNPHLGADTHKAIASAIHKSIKKEWDK